MSEQSDRRDQPPSGGQQSSAGQRSSSGPGGGASSWERRASELSGDLQRWLIKTSARNVRDDLGDQVKRAIRGPRPSAEDVWETATTEPPDALEQAPECAWCPICRAARRMAQAQAQAAAQAASRPASAARTAPRSDSGGAPGWYGAADALVGAARGALSGLDAILSYRPPEGGAEGSGPANGRPQTDAGTSGEKSEDEPDHRG